MRRVGGTPRAGKKFFVCKITAVARTAKRRRGPGRPPGARGETSRESLLEAARDELAARGTSAFTLRGVAERAGVQAPLLNYYFGSRGDLLGAVVDDAIRERHPAMIAALKSEGSPAERLTRFVSFFVARLAETPYLAQLFQELVISADDERTRRFAEQFGNPIFASLVATIQEGQARGDFGDLDPRYAAIGVMSLCVHFYLAAPLAQRLDLLGPSPAENAQDYARNVTRLLLDGLMRRRDA